MSGGCIGDKHSQAGEVSYALQGEMSRLLPRTFPLPIFVLRLTSTDAEPPAAITALAFTDSNPDAVTSTSTGPATGSAPKLG